MSDKVLIRESTLKRLIVEELSKNDIKDMFKNDRDLEKRVKKIASEVVIDLFRVLWQRKSFFEAEIGR